MASNGKQTNGADGKHDPVRYTTEVSRTYFRGTFRRIITTLYAQS